MRERQTFVSAPSLFSTGVALGILITLLLVGCQTTETRVEPEGPTLGDIPIITGAEPLDPETLPISLIAVTQAHRETVDDEIVGHFRVEEAFLDMVEHYDDEMKRLGWRLVDTLRFGDGGNVRRYHRGDQRAILAFEPEDGTTEFMLMQGTVR
ncbi:MAG: hypothetical protein M3220_15430 [Chloroflexota bacterium]|nr:hypothetical protein [Chloroflexota bacterium]